MSAGATRSWVKQTRYVAGAHIKAAWDNPPRFGR
jgi:hypothetical protein